MENRNGLAVSAMVNHADGFGERSAAVAMLNALPAIPGRRSVGADKAYDTADFVAACRERGVTPTSPATAAVRARVPSMAAPPGVPATG